MLGFSMQVREWLFRIAAAAAAAYSLVFLPNKLVLSRISAGMIEYIPTYLVTVKL